MLERLNMLESLLMSSNKSVTANSMMLRTIYGFYITEEEQAVMLRSVYGQYIVQDLEPVQVRMVYGHYITKDV